jgi:hypothetical protein
MTKEQAESKLGMLVSLGALPANTVDVSYDANEENEPVIKFEYPISGGAYGVITIPIDPQYENLLNLASNLPIVTGQRVAALGVLLAP